MCSATAAARAAGSGRKEYVMRRRGLAALLAAAFLTAGVALGAVAHPLDDTVFAPIKAQDGIKIRLQTVADGLTAPLKGVVAPGDSRLFVVDQDGILWAINPATGGKTVFLDVSGRLVPLGVCGPNTFDERGLLGVAFHPDYATNGKLYTYTSEPTAGAPTFPTTLPAGVAPDHQNVLAEWRVRHPGVVGSTVDPTTRRELMRVSWPQFNHDGGDLAFGPDRMLYVAMGDGGGADDRDGELFTTAPPAYPACGQAPIVGHGEGNAQKLTNPLGKILRIDVNGSNAANGQYGIPGTNPFVGAGPGIVEEIWAFGLRNPFRLSFDLAAGALLASDAGQNDLEEADQIVRGGNYGWSFKEGTMFFHHNGNQPGFASPLPDPTRTAPPGLIEPIAQYDTHHEGHSIIGGFVYRGSAIPELRGHYVFGDYSALFRFPSGPNNFGRLFYLWRNQPKTGLREIREFRIEGRAGLDRALLGFAQDASGEVYALTNFPGLPFGDTGEVLKLRPAAR
jgi:glucose/arabinose dehydrogenase